ncbi:MAG TPA: NAD(P)H-hydrate dehydratase [Pirellulaceae bacterium]|nr:NAD(P)H-hydrate dehydratase [Pirellulaceae bacterium]
MNRHEFQLAARSFRAGRLSLSEFTEKVFSHKADDLPQNLTSSDESDKSDLPDGPTGSASTSPITIPHRPADAHKGLCGHVLVVGGSHEMPGAAALTGLAALRGGAGLVTVASSTSARAVVAAASPCLMTVDLGELNASADATTARDRLQPALSRATVIGLGPGLGLSDTTQQLTVWLYETSPLPIVVDADSINHLASSRTNLSAHAGPRILTPHVGELRRLTGSAQSPSKDLNSRDNQIQFARQLASSCNIVLVLKGARTFVTDGQREYFNTTGCSGLATAGTGDVLTGLIAALIGQGLSPFEAATTGCALHGLAGELAQQQYGTWSMIATDVIQNLGPAFQQLARTTE